MPYDLTNYLVIGVSSRALFDLTLENEIYEKEGLEAYCQYQLEHENDILQPGTGFALIEAMLNINRIEPGVRRTESSLGVNFMKHDYRMARIVS